MSVPNLTLALCAMTCLAAGIARAGEPVTWQFKADTGNGQVLKVELTAQCEEGWHIYALAPTGDEGPLPTVIDLAENAAYQRVGGPQEPEPALAMDPNFGMKLSFHGGTVAFWQLIERVSPRAFTVSGSVEYMACNDKTCLPPHTVPFVLEIPASY
ncbi:MAG TPA: protein-disulfide reductase DsbD family protein [Flavobacteriales bacterium]|nr:protein-disulfide reductase DsbD family protein [Flavobacteriales bacterium]